MLTSLSVPTSEQLREEFDFIKNSTRDGVAGVWLAYSGQPGLTLGISICTHGNEPSGLATLWHFRRQSPLQMTLNKGCVIFVLNNILAVEKYFAALELPEETLEQQDEKVLAKKKARFCNVNMNRLPANTLDVGIDDKYEVRRAKELNPIWAQFEIGLDIHSMSGHSLPPSIVVCGNLHNELITGFPIEDILTNILNVQIGVPAVGFYGKNRNIPVVGIEAGSHEDDSSFRCAIVCATALLQNLDMIDGKVEMPPREYQEYFIDGSIMFPSEDYSLVKIFNHKDKIKEGDVLATGPTGEKIIAPFDGHVIMPPTDTKVKNINEEVLFLARPAKPMRF